MWSEEYNDCLLYIDSYWDRVTRRPQEGNKRHSIPMPRPYIVPNDKKFNTIFYWDSYFMFRGLMGTKRASLMKDMVENFMYLFNLLGIIPNSNLSGLTGRSQPPFLTSMILDVFQTPHNHQGLKKNVAAVLPQLHTFSQRKWLRDAIELAKKEYFLVWMDVEDVYNHKVAGYSLARYGDRDIGYAHSSEIESGWDFTSRYYSRCNEFLPVDLNVYLYKYELDFSLVSSTFSDTHSEIESWKNAAENRKNQINKYMWNDEKGFYFDYEYTVQQQSKFLSLAGFIPLWAGIPTFHQAERMRDMLRFFECDYGLTITAKESLAPQIDISNLPKEYQPAIQHVLQPKQWDWPNIWSPVEYLVVVGLLKYGFTADARRIMEKSVKAHANVYRTHGTFLEKLNGITGGPSENHSHYLNQPGFGWTNAVFYRYIKLLDAMEEKDHLFLTNEKHEPPYDLAVLH